VVRLPPEIRFEKQHLGGTTWAYMFRHASLGALGRILLQEEPGGVGTRVTCEVAGDLADPTTARRRAVFEPIGLEISRQMGEATGGCSDTVGPAPPSPPDLPQRIANKLLQCSRCDAFVARLIYAPEASDDGRFEDYARLMYPEYVRTGLPTWIIGAEHGLGSVDAAAIVKVWPERGPIEQMTPDAFNAEIGTLADSHCT